MTGYSAERPKLVDTVSQMASVSLPFEIVVSEQSDQIIITCHKVNTCRHQPLQLYRLFGIIAEYGGASNHILLKIYTVKQLYGNIGDGIL